MSRRDDASTIQSPERDNAAVARSQPDADPIAIRTRRRRCDRHACRAARGGARADVVVLCEHVMKRLDTALGKVDDSGGYLLR